MYDECFEISSYQQSHEIIHSEANAENTLRKVLYAMKKMPTPTQISHLEACVFQRRNLKSEQHQGA